MTEIERIEHARWALERNIGWIVQAEVKVAVVISLNIAMVGAMAASYTTTTNKTPEATVLTLFFGLVVLVAFFCSVMVVKPRLEGPVSSYIFFGKIVAKDRVMFAEDFAKAGAIEFLRDLTDQLHRNAEIACEKHEWVEKATLWSLCAGAIWVPVIVFLTRS